MHLLTFVLQSSLHDVESGQVQRCRQRQKQHSLGDLGNSTPVMDP